MTGRDAQLRALLRIKKARETTARTALTEAAHEEGWRRTFRDNARDHRDTCATEADRFFQRRFAERGARRDFASFFESVAVGHRQAKRARLHAEMIHTRLDLLHGAAESSRESAAQDLFSKTRGVEALENLLDLREREQGAMQDVIEEDDLSEIARKPDAL